MRSLLADNEAIFFISFPIVLFSYFTGGSSKEVITVRILFSPPLPQSCCAENNTIKEK